MKSFLFIFTLFLPLSPLLAQDSTEGDEIDSSIKEVHRLTNLPHLYINTFSGQSITSKTEYVYARMWYVSEDDEITFFDSLQIRGRGNSTWGLAKKPYKLKFLHKEKLLGKGFAKAKKWTLLANHADKSLIRNALTSLMGDTVGLPFSPAAKFVDLTLNDSYVGNYQISDQIDVRAHRVNISEQDVPLIETSDISGGYLLESDGFRDFHTGSLWDNESQRYLAPNGFNTRKNIPIRIHYPDDEDLEVQQTNYIQDFINQFEQRLFADDFTDPEKGYRQNVDSASLANWYLCTEMSGNVDGFFSLYFYKEQQDDHLYWGPLWDYDIAYNNDNRTDRGGNTSDTSRQLMVEHSYGAAKIWLQRMWQDPWFARLVNRRYAELLDAGIEEHLSLQIDSLYHLLTESAGLNYQRWGISTSTLRERVLYSSYGQYISDLRSYLRRHLPYLKTAFEALLPEEPAPIEPDEPKIPDFAADPTVYYVLLNAGTGTAMDIDIEHGTVCSNARDEMAESQQWQIIPLQNGYCYIVNRATGYALNDPTEGEPTATTLVGAQLNVIEGDSLDLRQQWDLVAQSNERYNIINSFSQHGANLSGGSTANGTAILSYTSNEKDATSNNRMWNIQAVAHLNDPDDPIVGIGHPGIYEYALAYDAQSDRLHFGSDDLSALRFPVRVYDRGGRLVRSFRASDGAILTGLPRGLYIVTWIESGRQRTVKFTR